jgi:glycerol-3-phosphate acyltransferase PlsY
VAKGALPVFYFPRLFPSAYPELWAIGYGLAAILGHVRPIFLLGRGGGKGVATASGVFLGLAPLPLLVSFAVFVVTLKASGYVSLGSLLSSAVLPLALWFTHGPRSPVFWVSIVLAAFVFYTHRANIGRLRRGEEHRFGKRRGDDEKEGKR